MDVECVEEAAGGFEIDVISMCKMTANPWRPYNANNGCAS